MNSVDMPKYGSFLLSVNCEKPPSLEPWGQKGQFPACLQVISRQNKGVKTRIYYLKRHTKHILLATLDATAPQKRKRNAGGPLFLC